MYCRNILKGDADGGEQQDVENLRAAQRCVRHSAEALRMPAMPRPVVRPMRALTICTAVISGYVKSMVQVSA